MWQVWVDTGGTFTDCVAVDPEGRERRVKVLSSGRLRARLVSVGPGEEVCIENNRDLPDGFLNGALVRFLGAGTMESTVLDFEASSARLHLSGPLPDGLGPGAFCEIDAGMEAPVLAAHLVTGTALEHKLPCMAFRLATTRGTNALLECRGGPIALFVTEGFGDLLEIGTQQRPELFALAIEKSKALPDHIVEVPERLAADGTVIRELDLEALDDRVQALIDSGVRHAAVALVNAYREPIHEQELCHFLIAKGFAHVSVSTELAPLINLLQRAQTAVVDAYLTPVVGPYLESTSSEMAGGTMHVMTSAGGLTAAASYSAKDCLLSGPAGGVVGSALAGRASGRAPVIAFDMGGTSTDVSRWGGDFEYVFSHQVGGIHLAAPALAIETVAAGGGSVCAFDRGRLTVGPRSAGADPGPACYGAGGPLTITDVNLLLGRIVPERFEIPLQPQAASRVADVVRDELVAATSENSGREVMLAGFLRIANERMANAIRQISVRRGYDPADHVLVAFGGAGPQHACAVAELLGMRAALIPPRASLLSAVGLGHAVVERFVHRQVLAPLHESTADLDVIFAELEAEAKRAVQAEAPAGDEVLVRRHLAFVRMQGQESAVELEWAEGVKLDEAFPVRYGEIFGYPPPERELELESLRVVASTRPRDALAPPDRSAHESPQPGSQRVFVAGEWRTVSVVERDGMAEGECLIGPALVVEAHSVTVVEHGWTVVADRAGALVLERVGEAQSALAIDAVTAKRPRAVELELFSNRFSAIARDMGEVLQRTALSTNIRDRLDFSCAILDPEGRLVVNAPHIPVHLGALGLCVRRLREYLDLEPGDVVVTNHPRFGGSHLPDVTVVSPVFAAGDGDRLLGYVANRAHHAEIGGIRPGSVPPDATCLAEEGVVIPPTLAVRGGVARWQDLRSLLETAAYPSRAVADNLADLEAAVAANTLGANALRHLASSFGSAVVIEQMVALRNLAARLMGEALASLPDGRREVAEELDDGAVLRALVEIAGQRVAIDFAGSAAVHPGNLNATPAVVQSAVLYVLRLLLAEELPLNEGLLEPVSLRIPTGLLNPDFPDDPARAPAVVGGNVETSQRLVDTLLKAFENVACSQGTMNNIVFGDDTFGYYETVAGGCGAGDGFDGADAVHSHMTNTRLTDPEVVEHRFPVRLLRCAVRRGSGGRGRHRGGDGVIREICFLRPVEISLLTQHRRVRPYGMAGGEPGQTGRQCLVRADGEVIELGSVAGIEAEPGDRLIIETPGGGGWGDPRFS